MKGSSEQIKLTKKQEAFCQEYILCGVKSEAYRKAYDTENMTDKSVWELSSVLSKDLKVSSRIEQLQKEAAERNKITLDQVIKHISEIATFDIADCYDEKGNLLPIHDIPLAARGAITSIKALEEFDGFGKDRTSIGFTKEIKLLNKLDAFEKLMKHLGGYEKDNAQKKPEVNLATLDDSVIQQLLNASESS